MASDTSSKPNIPAIPRSQAVKQYIEPSYSTLLQLQNDMAPGRQQKKQQLQQLQTLRESKYTNKRTIQKWRHQIWVVPWCWAPHMLVKIMLFCCFSFVLHLYGKQTLANRGPDSRFILGAIIKALIFKLSRSSTMMCVLNEMGQTQTMNCKTQLWMCKLKYSNTWLLFNMVFNLK